MTFRNAFFRAFALYLFFLSKETASEENPEDVQQRQGQEQGKLWLPGATGSGPYEVALAWAAAFSARYPEVTVTLQSVGSGSAQKAMWGDVDCEKKPIDSVCGGPQGQENSQADGISTVEETLWGLGDAPIDSQVLLQRQSGMGLQQLPACAGAISIVYSREVVHGNQDAEGEVSDQPLRLTFDVLASILNRTITHWDDDRIRSLNPLHARNLPHQPIAAVVRQDSSGQTSIVTDALGYNVPTWPAAAVGKKPAWPLGDLLLPSDIAQQQQARCLENTEPDDTQNGNTTQQERTYQHYEADGKTQIALGMLRIPYSLGYMEMGYAGGFTDFLDQARIVVTGETSFDTWASADSLRNTMGGLANQIDPLTMELNLARADTPPGGYPISGYTYWYMKRHHSAYDSCYQAWLMCKFVEWSFTDPQAAELAERHSWVVPPEEVVNITLKRLDDVMCLDTEVNPPRVRPALSYTPEPYRMSTDDSRDFILWYSLVPAAVFLIILLIMCNCLIRKQQQGDSLWLVKPKELILDDPPKVIGRGSFGTVMLGTYRGTPVAVKRALHAMDTKAKDPNASTMLPNESVWAQSTRVFFSTSKNKNTTRKMFVEEMRILSKLRHPCITTVMGAIVEKGKDPMLLMEYMEKGSLYDILLNDTAVLTLDMILPILQDIIQGVRFLHQADPAVIHGDLKARNILVDKFFRAKVTDFGLSSHKQSGKGICGTPYWMAPELLRGDSGITTATDVYAFGMILYEVFARKDPYEGEEMSVVLRQVKDPSINKRPRAPKEMPLEIENMMKECFSANADHRPSAEEIANRLSRMNSSSITANNRPVSRGDDSILSLEDIFPQHIAQALREGRKTEPEFKENVTIFFSDVVDFTELASVLAPHKVAKLLDRLYKEFDDLSVKYDLFKVETIGDSYMAVSNLVKDQSEDHVKRIAMFAIEAVRAANQIPVDPDDISLGNLSIRAGFHTGPVVADVVGNRSPRYCLFGDTVNCASRMESNSEADRIQCSRTSQILLQRQMPELDLALRGAIKIKGKGMMTTFWVNEIAESSSSKEESTSRDSTKQRVRITEISKEQDGLPPPESALTATDKIVRKTHTIKPASPSPSLVSSSISSNQFRGYLREGIDSMDYFGDNNV